VILMRCSIASYALPLLIGLELILGCGTTTSTSRAVKPSVLAPEAIKVVGEIGWSPRQLSGSRKYFIHDSSIVSVSTDTSQTRSTETSTFYSVRVSRSSDSFVLMAKVDSLLTTSQSPSLKAPVNIDPAREFRTILSATGQLFLPAQDSTSLCPDGVTPAAARIYELVLSYPERALKIGDSWTDTVSTTVCRSKIPLHQRAIRIYQILSFTTWNQQSAVIISRNVSSILSTDSKQIPNHLGVAGSGESSTFIYANQATGVLLQSDTRSQSTLAVRTSRGVFPFRQIISTHIELH